MKTLILRLFVLSVLTLSLAYAQSLGAQSLDAQSLGAQSLDVQSLGAQLPESFGAQSFGILERRDFEPSGYVLSWETSARLVQATSWRGLYRLLSGQVLVATSREVIRETPEGAEIIREQHVQDAELATLNWLVARGWRLAALDETTEVATGLSTTRYLFEILR